jgi:hypothetical protein
VRTNGKVTLSSDSASINLTNLIAGDLLQKELDDGEVMFSQILLRATLSVPLPFVRAYIRSYAFMITIER